jgi:hypothetical protein
VPGTLKPRDHSYHCRLASYGSSAHVPCIWYPLNPAVRSTSFSCIQLHRVLILYHRTTHARPPEQHCSLLHKLPETSAPVHHITSWLLIRCTSCVHVLPQPPELEALSRNAGQVAAILLGDMLCYCLERHLRIFKFHGTNPHVCEPQLFSKLVPHLTRHLLP